VIVEITSSGILLLVLGWIINRLYRIEKKIQSLPCNADRDFCPNTLPRADLEVPCEIVNTNGLSEKNSAEIPDRNIEIPTDTPLSTGYKTRRVYTSQP